MLPRRLTRTLLFLAALFAAGRLAWAESDALTPGSLIPVDLDRGEQAFELSVSAETLCDICAFPAEGYEAPVTARLYRGDELLEDRSGELTLITRRLEPDAPCTLRLSGTGRVWLELARHALSRCFDDPKPLNAAGDSYAKAIVNPGDAHWYAVTADESLPLVLTGLPEDAGLSLEARLFSASGRLLAEATRTDGGAFLMDFMPRAGRTYRIRVSAPGGGVGLYALNLSPLNGNLPERLLLDADSATLQGRESRPLTARAVPAGAAGAMLWESSDPDVVSVSQTGTLTGCRPGTAVVTAYAPGAVRARCRGEVRRVPVEALELITARVHMHAGDDVALEWTLLPENASEPGVTFEISPEGVATVDENGVLRAVGVGSATLTARTVDGGIEAAGTVSVAPAQKRYRALLVGEQSYAADVAPVRPGSANSVSGMRHMLNELSFLGARFQTATALDISRDGLLSAIETAFEGAQDRDESLFYITCHGYYAHGMTVFQMYDGSELTAVELRQALDRVPGAVTLLLDCCGSGGVTGQTGDMLDGITRVFGGPTGPALFNSSRYRVLASALVDQDSYRLSFDSTAQESSMATLFARAVCEAGGWNIDAAARRAMRADVNYDDVVTLDELYRYARRRVMWYLSLTGAGYAQTVLVSPQGDTGALFARTRAKE